MFMSDPHARALTALEQLYAPTMDPVALCVWQTAQEAMLEAQSRHAALMAELRLLRNTIAVGGSRNESADVPLIGLGDEDAQQPSEEADPLQVLRLVPEDPLFILQSVAEARDPKAPD